MKLLLASAGFSTPEIVNACVELVGKPQDQIRFAVINEAYAVEHGDHSWVLDDLNRLHNNFPGGMELVNLLALDLETVKQRIELADVLFAVGGHTDYLMSVFNKTGLAGLLPEILRSKVYVGSSAGSMILGRRISTEAYNTVYGEENNYGITEYLNIVDFAMKPHFNNSAFPNNREEVLRDVAKDYDSAIYALTDDSAIVVNGTEQNVIGSPPLVIA